MTNTKTFTTVPAAPGFAVLHLVYRDGRVFDLKPEPIIAWVIESWVEQDGDVRARVHAPVTCGRLPPDPYECELPDPYERALAVLRPDGSVDLPGMGTFHSAAKYLLYLREELDGEPGEALEAVNN